MWSWSEPAYIRHQKVNRYVFILRSIQSVGPFKALYTSPPDRTVHSDTNSTCLGSILASCNYARRLFIFNHISTAVYSQVLIYTAESTGASWREQKCPNIKTVAKEGFERGLSRLRVRHSTTELPRFVVFSKKRCTLTSL